MSGPSLPRPIPGSNAIGKFIIGVSPIGPIIPFDFWDTVISQYANSPIIDTLLQSWSDCLDQTANVNAFYDDIMDVSTASGPGLDVIGEIVNVSRTLNVVTGQTYLGFEEALPGVFGFNQAQFFPGGSITNNFVLTDPAYKTLLYAKMLFNITDGSIKSINNILLSLFPHRGNCYVQDNLNMTMVYVFQFSLSLVELSIVETSGVLPRPSGVSVTVQLP